MSSSHTPASAAQRLADAQHDLAGAEKAASQTITLHGEHIPMLLGIVGIIISLFMPHSGQVLGLDVLFFSDTAKEYVTTVPERIYVWLAVIGPVLLGLATIFTRSMLIALLAWVSSGSAMFYSLFAIWMRQSRPPTEPGVGPSFGLVGGALCVTVVAISLSFIVFRRSNFQKALNAARAQQTPPDAVAVEQERILAEEKQATTPAILVDDRRARAAARRRQRAEDGQS